VATKKKIKKKLKKNINHKTDATTSEAALSSALPLPYFLCFLQFFVVAAPAACYVASRVEILFNYKPIQLPRAPRVAKELSRFRFLVYSYSILVPGQHQALSQTAKIEIIALECMLHSSQCQYLIKSSFSGVHS